MKQELAFLGGIGLGAGLMYLLDPQTGRRRRSLVRNQVESAFSRVDDVIDATARDVYHRAQGLWSEGRSLLADEPVEDSVLVERVRSKLGRFVSHPHAIEVKAQNGRIALSGPILQRELAPLMRCVSSVQGVADVDNRLEVHEQADTSALQGGRPRPGETRFGMRRANWAPATRLMAGTIGSALIGYSSPGIFQWLASTALPVWRFWREH